MNDDNSQSMLPSKAPSESFGALSVPQQPLGSFSDSAAPADHEVQARSLSHYLWVIRRHRWQIISFVIVSVVLGSL